MSHIDNDLFKDFQEDFEEAMQGGVQSPVPVPQKQSVAVAPGSNPMQAVWQLPQQTTQAALDVAKIYRTTHGMFAGVPILCKGDDCPYIEICIIDPSLRLRGYRCPMEAGAIIARYEAWCGHFGIDLSGGAVKPEDLVDATLIRDLVDNEIQTLRAENRLAISGDFIGKTISQVDTKGKEHYEDTVTPEAEFKLALLDKRYKILNLLNSTRKDKAKNDNKIDPSTKAVSIFKKIGEMVAVDLDDVDFSQPRQVEEIQDAEIVPNKDLDLEVSINIGISDDEVI